MNRFFSLLLTAVTLVTFSCKKPKINLTSEYKDVTIVYGLINQQDRYQYIKIYKGYLTNENAIAYASNLDNISYYNDIDVKMEEYVDGNLKRTYHLDTVMSIPKDPGTFAAPTQVLYRLKNSLEYGGGHTYRLVITNKKTGEVVTGETEMIDDNILAFNVPGPGSGIGTIDWTFEDPWDIGCKTSHWPKQAEAIDAYVTFRYIEKNKLTGDTVHKAIRDVMVTSGFEHGNVAKFKPVNILKMIGRKLSADENVERYVDYYKSPTVPGITPYVCVDIKLWVCDETYYTYNMMSQPSSSIVTDLLAYTNMQSTAGLKSAYGFFASRTSVERHFKISDIEHNEDSLISGQYTRHLGFRPFTELLD